MPTIRSLLRNVSLVVLACLPMLAWSAPPFDAADGALVQNLAIRPIGPAVMGGRITDIEVLEAKPSTYYVAAATGGLWKTTNNGTTWTPLFDNERTNSIGSVAISQSKPDIIYVGTGESNLRNSVSYGDGVYRSEDGGKTWKNVGLEDSRHIGQIVVHPENPDLAYVAAVGHAWGPNKQRGLYKTSDGGKTWSNTNDLGEDCGFIDVVMDPNDPETLYAAAYQVRRGLGSGDGKLGDRPEIQFGPDAGIYKTTDGGKTWTKLAKGLPTCQCGRIGLAVHRKNPKIVMAMIQTEKTDTSKIGGPTAQRDTDPETGGVFRSVDGGATWVKLNKLSPRPFYFSKLRIDPNDPDRVYVLGIALHVSDDGGKTFRNDGARKVHGDHHAMWIDPADSEHLILGNDGGLYTSNDGGKNWEAIHNIPLAQYYGVAVDNRKPYWVYGGLQDNGTWAGPSRTRRTEGIGNADWLKVEGGDGYRAAVDPSNSAIIYCESQYGRLVRHHRDRGERTPIQPKPEPNSKEAYRFNWCAPIVLSPHDPKTLYFGGQYVFRSDNQGRSWKVISPDLTRGKPDTGTLTALAQSPKDPAVLWAGSADGFIQVSTDGGAKWVNVTDQINEMPIELDRNGLVLTAPAGAQFFAEWPASFKALQNRFPPETTNAFREWLKEFQIKDRLPVTVPPDAERRIPLDRKLDFAASIDDSIATARIEGRHLVVRGKKEGRTLMIVGRRWLFNVEVRKQPTISDIECSHHDSATAYVAVDRHRTDDYRPYLYKTTDHGKTWKSIIGDLPNFGHVHVIREDRKNKNLLFVGSELGLFVSLDGGEKWQPMKNGLPTVAVNDLVIHPRDNELVIGTHGRGVFIADIASLQDLSTDTLRTESYLFDLKPATQWRVRLFQGATGGAKAYFAPNPPVGATIWYYVKDKPGAAPTITITDKAGAEIVVLEGAKEAGLRSVFWDLRTRVKNPEGKLVPGPMVRAGEYTVSLTAAGTTWTKSLTVLADE